MVRIVLAQTLKPASETRIYEKLAKSLAEIPNVEISIFGQISNYESEKSHDNPTSIPVALFSNRNNFSERLNNGLLFWNSLIQKKPHLIIVCSPELLLVAIAFKLCFDCKLIWDVQENYPLNFKHHKIYGIIRSILLSSLSSIYFQIVAKWIDHFWLAEKVFCEQLKLQPEKISILENKVPVYWNKFTDNSIKSRFEGPYFFFSGVISEESGILKAITFFKFWSKFYPDWSLLIAGIIPDRKLQETLIKEAESPRIKLIGFTNWVPSNEIHLLLKNAKAVLMPYRETPANEGKIPTKMWEAWFCGKPLLVHKAGHWSNANNTIQIDFENPGKNELSAVAAEIAVGKNPLQETTFDTKKLKSDFFRIMNPDRSNF